MEISPPGRVGRLRRSPSAAEAAEISQFRPDAQQWRKAAQRIVGFRVRRDPLHGIRFVAPSVMHPLRACLIRPDITLRRAGIKGGLPAAYFDCNTKEFVMHMMDWNAYRQQVVAGVGGFAKLSPETVRGYGAMGSAGQKTGQLDGKTRELIAVAVAVTLRCDGCITVHTEAARKLGATKEEIAEALGVAVSVNAGAAIVYSTRTLDAYAASAEAALAAA